MRAVPGGRHCESCEKTVYDLRFATAHTARGLALVHGRDGFCARLTVDDDGWGVFSPGRPLGSARRASSVAAALTALSLAACGNAAPPRVVVVSPPLDADAGAALDGGDELAATEVPAACASPDGGPKVVVVTQGGVGSVIELVHFATGSSTVPAEAGTLLDAVADTIKAHPELKAIVVEGHADSSEPGAQPLSDERAKKVIAALVKRGIDASRLVAKAYGSTRPIADNATPTGREKNRRVEFRVDESP